MNEKIPVIVHENQMARLERANKRFFVLVIILIVVLVVTNVLWIRYEMQWQDESVIVTQDIDSGDGDNATLTNGDIGINE